MTRNLRFSAVFAAALILSVSSFAQSDPYSGTDPSFVRGTVIDVDNGRARLQVETDDGQRMVIETDTVATQYHGFGTVIAGKPEIFTGSKGFSNIRLGDRVDVRGTTRANGLFVARLVTLIGREVAASSVGVGQTRPQTSVATPPDERTAPVQATTGGVVEGTIRQINLAEGNLVIQTGQRRMMTVRTHRNTPVVYRGESTYRVSNLEVGDVIRVEAEPRDAQADDISARRIEVVRAVQESDTGRNAGGVVTMIDGRVARVEPGLDYAYIDDGRGEVRVDMSRAEDATGNPLRARDLRIGDRVEITGSFNRAGEIFLASTLRFSAAPVGVRGDEISEVARYAVVTITGTVTETLEDAPTVALRDRDTNLVVRLWATEDFIVRTRGGTNTTAGNLRVNDVVVVKAFRDAAGNLVAQTIRLRNR